eukprot:TCONS_00042236-protein
MVKHQNFQKKSFLDPPIFGLALRYYEELSMHFAVEITYVLVFKMTDHDSDQEPSTSACPNRFSKKCAAEGHGELPHVALLSLLNIDCFSKAKRFTAADRVSLVKAGVIKERSRFICRICHKKGLLNKNYRKKA